MQPSAAAQKDWRMEEETQREERRRFNAKFLGCEDIVEHVGMASVDYAEHPYLHVMQCDRNWNPIVETEIEVEEPIYDMAEGEKIQYAWVDGFFRIYRGKEIGEL